MKLRTVAMIASSMSFAAFVAIQANGKTSDPAVDGYVFVYFPSQCVVAGDASNCHEIPSFRVGFPTPQECDTYATSDLNKFGDPKRLGSCQRMKEA